jgi:hypothetical protein
MPVKLLTDLVSVTSGPSPTTLRQEGKRKMAPVNNTAINFFIVLFFKTLN